jgi:hypothetical protein
VLVHFVGVAATAVRHTCIGLVGRQWLQKQWKLVFNKQLALPISLRTLQVSAGLQQHLFSFAGVQQHLFTVCGVLHSNMSCVLSSPVLLRPTW